MTGAARFIGWGVVGFLSIFSWLIFPVGLLAYPLIGIAAWALGRKGAWPEILGLGLGTLPLALGIWYFNRNATPCTEETLRHSSCGGADPTPFLWGAAIISAFVILLFVAQSLRDHRSDT